MQSDVDHRITWAVGELWLDTTGLSESELEDAERHVEENYPVGDILGVDVDFEGQRVTIYETYA